MESGQNFKNLKRICTRVALPFFMASRNRIKYTKLNELRTHIAKMRHVYDACGEEDVAGEAKEKYTPFLAARRGTTGPTKGSHQLSENSWKLPPNLYDTSKIPYSHKRGSGGAHWQKAHTHQAKICPDIRPARARFDSLRKISQAMQATCHRAKGVFLTNARQRRATARCMIDNVATCYRDPSYPGPATYNPIRRTPISSSNNPNRLAQPHLFYRSSSVAVKENSIHPAHTSFTGAPGRYEIRYSKVCPCPSARIYQPQLDLVIDKEKRNKFRRLPYTRIKACSYTSPDWRHVKGLGHRYLFKSVQPTQHKPIQGNQDIKGPKNIPLYPDSKYIAMINNPVRVPLSLRADQAQPLRPRITFNCTTKKIVRKQLRNNKKIAFSSTQERFPDSYRLPVLTQQQQEAAKRSLPLERQLRDQAVITKPASELKSKLSQTPQHMLPNYVPKLRRKMFKFQPLPQPRLLVTERGASVRDSDDSDGYYLSAVDPKKYFKEEAPL